jgi:hypothetical protein
MADELAVDPGEINHDGDSFVDLGNLATSIGDDFEEQITGLGDFYGDDETGRSFKAVWVPTVTGSVESLRSTGQGMTFTGRGLHLSAGSYIHTDEVNADSVQAPPSIRH